jgi:hypothetical protein
MIVPLTAGMRRSAIWPTVMTKASSMTKPVTTEAENCEETESRGARDGEDRPTGARVPGAGT